MARLRINVFRRGTILSEPEIRRLHRLAETDIQTALEPFGYYNSTVESKLSRTGDTWRADYYVESGKPVIVASISVTLTGSGRDNSALVNPQSLFNLGKGDVLNQVLYDTGKRELRRRAFLAGFIDGRFDVHEIRIDRSANTGTITLVFNTGEQARIGRIIVDQAILDDDLLRRYLGFSQGEPYDPHVLLEAQRALNRTDFFQFASVEGDLENRAGSEVPVVVRLEELEKYNLFSFGLGYATDTEALRSRPMEKSAAQPAWSSPQQFGADRPITEFSGGGLSYPDCRSRFNTLVGSGAIYSEEWENTNIDAFSVGGAYEYVSEMMAYGFSLEWLSEDYTAGNTSGDNQLLIPTLRGSVAIADNVVTTENGLRLGVELSGASDHLFSDATFGRARLDGRLILSPIPRWRLIGRGALGVLLVDDIEDVPPSVRFYAGGPRTVRGYRFRSLSPENEQGFETGGKYLLAGGIEIERQIAQMWRLGLFYDAGNALSDTATDLPTGSVLVSGWPCRLARPALISPIHSKTRGAPNMSILQWGPIYESPPPGLRAGFFPAAHDGGPGLYVVHECGVDVDHTNPWLVGWRNVSGRRRAWSAGGEMAPRRCCHKNYRRHR
jgi:translocation and assembly module TamA